MNAADVGPVPDSQRTQSAFDLFNIFAAANIVATTMQVGASLAGGVSLRTMVVLVALGALAGSALVAALAPLGPRLGVPSVIAARAALGLRGAGLVAVILYVTNFAWIAVNNVIAASACARVAGGPGSLQVWVVALGIVSTAVVAMGPRAVSLADRFAVPLLLTVGALITVAVLRIAGSAPAAAVMAPLPWFRGLDIVIGYQVSWILMFADYSRYTRSERGSAAGVFLGLFLTSLWLMPVGFLAARAAGSSQPGEMVRALGLGWPGAILIAVATITTNFVNIYLSSLAWKSLFPRVSDQWAVWTTGLVGTALGLFSGAWLSRYADFMLVLGSVLVPVGGVLVAHYFVLRHVVRADDLYDSSGPYGRHLGFSVPGLLAWGLGALAYALAGEHGATLPSLVTSILVYVLAVRWMAGIRSQELGARN
jgi:nucleobase:cation symporter-1, NCS1 family